MTRAWRQYTALAFLLACAGAFQAGNLSYVIQAMRHPSEVSSPPFQLVPATRTIATGPLAHDEILSIDGQAFRAAGQFYEAVYRGHPGDRLDLVLSEPSGRAFEQSVPLGDQTANFNSVSAIALMACLDLFIPLVCLGLGFLVAFIRPRDPNAWLLLLLLIGFSGLVGRSDWYNSWPVTFLWQAFGNATWSIWMMLFAIRFPTRFPADRRRPWMKWLLLGPSIVAAAAFWSAIWVWNHDINAPLLPQKLFGAVYFANTLLQIFSVSVFFTVLGIKSGTETSPDDRRRLKILRTGASFGLGPMALVIVYSLIRRSDLFTYVPWPVEVFALLMNALFPVTLAYVIVVERAMDLRFVIRQSVQYAIAKLGVWALRIAIGWIFVALLVNNTRGASVWVTAGIGAMGLVVFRQSMASRASTWVDRKFFREAYDAETVLSELAAEAGRYVEIDPLLEKVARRISDTLHVPDIVILVREGRVFRTRYSTRSGEPMDIAADSRILAAPETHDGPLQVYFDKPQPWMRALSTEELQTLVFMRSELLLALRGRGSEDGQAAGIMSLGPKMSGEPYSKTDIRLLQAIAVQMGMALENSRLAASLVEAATHREAMNRELEIAREVQERLFPQKLPHIAGIDCFGYCRPARGVGGDYYDFIRLPEGRLGIAIGDVSGKGMAAALLMANLQASLRGQTMAGVRDLAELMRNVNKLVYDASTSNRYATFFYGEFDGATKTMSYVNAGHNAPLILRGDGVLRLEASGPVVGLLPEVSYAMEECRIEAGDIFLGYTDGISEALNERGEEWEEERFVAAARRGAERCSGERSAAAQYSNEIIDEIMRSADAFTGAAAQYDDMTLVVVQFCAV
jgi:sigma-B regulation protein RsbU (phosphoserine phosphatase)